MNPTGWLHPTLARPNGVLFALLRAAAEYAVCHGCVEIDLGSGGGAAGGPKRRLGAREVQPECMVRR